MITRLNDVPTFKNISSVDLQAISLLAMPIQFDPVEDIPFFDAAGESIFYVLWKGHTKITYQKHENLPVRICGPGDIIGYGEWYCTFPHKAESLSHVSAWGIPRTSFQQLMYKTPELQECMIKTLCEIITNKDERIAALENYSVSNRVASLLLSFSKKFGKETPAGLYINAKVDRDTMAKLAGTVTESLSRQLSDFEAEKIIAREGRSIIIIDRQKLEMKSRQ